VFVVNVWNVMGFDWLFGLIAVIGQNWSRCVLIYRVPCRMSDVRSPARITFCGCFWRTSLCICLNKFNGGSYGI